MKRNFTLALLMLMWGVLTVGAVDRVTLTFKRTGTGATDFAVTVNGAPGATATVSKSSHELMGTVDNAIICPNVNGNTSPTINLEIKINGLPEGMKFNAAGLFIHAFNSAGAYQSSTDGKNRKYNVKVAVNGNNFATYNDIDISAGITGANKHWETKAANEVVSSDPLTLSLTVTAGSANVGCFFGLQAIVLGDGSAPFEKEPEPTPDGPDHNAAKVYTIRWQNNSTSYITEQADGSLAVGDYSIANKVFWEFIPTQNENCFYIKNTATGHYLGSCNMVQNAASRVSVSTTPQEYYVGGPVSTSGVNNNCFWLSSTDCENYNTADASAGRGLNKDGGSSYIITYYTGTGNVGSYWSIEETGDLYEVQPFTPSAQIGAVAAAYHIINAQGLAYNANGKWEALSPQSKAQQWYFVGNSNAGGGYQIVSMIDNTPLNDGTKYTVDATEGFAPYHFMNGEQRLQLGDESEFTFTTARSEFALKYQIYKMPCGSTGDVFIQKANIGNDFRYPMPTYANNSVTNGNASAPANKYVFLTRDMATVVQGDEQVPLAIALNRAPGSYKVYLYLDWDKDGFFEVAQELEGTAQEITTTFAVPADAALGKTRARLRVTDNGLAGADDDTHGEVLDLLLNVVRDGGELIEPVIMVNDHKRGEATWADGIALATAKNQAMFLYWSENYRVVSVENTYEIAASTLPRTLMAYFTPESDEITGIDDEILASVDNDAQIIFDRSKITVRSVAQVKAIVVFATDGAKVAGTNSDMLLLNGVSNGVYIVKAITANGMASAKIII